MATKLITFKTNHTIIGDIIKTDEIGLVVKEPLQVVMQPSKEGSTIAFAPFVEYAKEFKTGFTISHSDILFVAEPIEELAEQYRQVFSRIQLATQLPQA